MYKRVSLRFINNAAKLYSNAFIHSVHHKFIISQFKYFTKTHALVTQGYCTVNPSFQVIEDYNKLYKEKLSELLKDPQYKAIYEKYKLEIEFLRHSTHKVPSVITDFDWLQLLKSTTRGQRRSYLEFRFKVEMKDQNRGKKTEPKQLKNNSAEEDDNVYGLSKYSMFFRIRDSTMNRFYNSRLISAMLHEPAIVFDCGYEPFMAPFEQQNCAKQLLLSFSANRIHDDPVNLYFCNANMDGLIMQRLHRIIPQIYDPDFPLNITEKSYLDVFDKKKLIYLTPHSNIVMTEYDPTLVYIIGAIVDKTNPRAISFQKAKQEGIRMMKFPLSETLEWGTGSAKNLPLNQVLSILLDLKATNDWKKALKHVPVRKLKDRRENMLIKKLEHREKRLNKILSSVKKY
ncbi:Mitochondrial ribonuclease P protein 1 homolog [Anthophora retusa]